MAFSPQQNFVAPDWTATSIKSAPTFAFNQGRRSSTGTLLECPTQSHQHLAVQFPNSRRASSGTLLLKAQDYPTSHPNTFDSLQSNTTSDIPKSVASTSPPQQSQRHSRAFRSNVTPLPPAPMSSAASTPPLTDTTYPPLNLLPLVQLHATGQLSGTSQLGSGRRGAISGPSEGYSGGGYESS